MTGMICLILVSVTIRIMHIKCPEILPPIIKERMDGIYGKGKHNGKEKECKSGKGPGR